MGDAAILAARDTQTEGWGSFMDGLISKANGPIRLGVAVSNVGKLDLPLAGKLAGEVRDVYFAQSSSSVGATIVLSVSNFSKMVADSSGGQLHFGTFGNMCCKQRRFPTTRGPRHVRICTERGTCQCSGGQARRYVECVIVIDVRCQKAVVGRTWLAQSPCQDARPNPIHVT